MMFVRGCRRVPRPPARITAVLTAVTLAAMHVVAEEQLLPLVLRRTGSLFTRDIEANADALTAKIRGARVLVTGADGSIGGSARFANVAFSRGSLLEGFLYRISKRQPIAAPKGIRRYFISSPEAAELCLIACFVGRNREVFVPKLGAEHGAIEMVEVA